MSHHVADESVQMYTEFDQTCSVLLVNIKSECRDFILLALKFYYQLLISCCCVSTEVLLDMRATGGELGWLTWPLEQGDKPGVSFPPSPLSSSALRLCLEFAFRINLQWRKFPWRLWMSWDPLVQNI